KNKNPLCSHCTTTKTSVWRRAKTREPLCNACYLYLKYNNSPRPESMWTKTLIKRRRKTKSGSTTTTTQEFKVSKSDRSKISALTRISSSRPSGKCAEKTGQMVPNQAGAMAPLMNPASGHQNPQQRPSFQTQVNP